MRARGRHRKGVPLTPLRQWICFDCRRTMMMTAAEWCRHRDTHAPCPAPATLNFVCYECGAMRPGVTVDQFVEMFRAHAVCGGRDNPHIDKVHLALLRQKRLPTADRASQRRFIDAHKDDPCTCEAWMIGVYDCPRCIARRLADAPYPFPATCSVRYHQ